MTGYIVKANSVDQTKLERHPERRRALEELAEAQAIKHRALGQMQNQIIDLSLAMTQQIIKQSVQMQPELLEQIYKGALGSAGRLTQSGGVLYVSADDKQTDLSRVASQLGFKVVADPNLSLAGCIVEVDGLQIDATIETAVDVLTRALKEHSHE